MPYLDTIEFYLEIDKKRYILPVNAEKIEVDIPQRNETTDVVKFGEINRIVKSGLKTISFESFFPTDRNLMYVNPRSTNITPERYTTLIMQASERLNPIRLIIPTTGINIACSIEEFKWWIEDTTGDRYYSLKVREWKDYSPRFIKNEKPKPAPRPAPPKQITMGCEVIVNGRLHRDSYGAGAGQTEVNARRKVNFIAKGRACPYHVTTLNGGWRGWVTAGSVKRV